MLSTPVTRSIEAAALKGQSDDVIRRVGEDQTNIVIEEAGVPVAVIIPVADFQRLQRYDARRDEQRRALQAFSETFRDESDDDIEQAVARAIADERGKSNQSRGVDGRA